MMTTGIDSAMFKTLHRQPADLRRVLSEEWGAAKEAAAILAKSKRVIMSGMGTSYCAAVAGAWMLRAAGADAWPINSYDLALYTDTFQLSSDDTVMILSHSGLKMYSHKLFQLAKASGAKIISVAGTEAEIEGADVVLRTTTREQSSSYTSSHLSAMATIAQMASELGALNGAAATMDFRRCLDEMPAQVEEVLARADDMEPFARRSANRVNYAVGGGPNEASAIEVVIKVREAAFGHIDGQGLEQYLHGPVCNLNPGDGMLLVNCPGNSSERVNVAARMFDAVGADMMVLGDAPLAKTNALVFPLPHTNEWLSPMLSVLPMQLFAYHMATAKGVNPDRARRDTPKYDSAIAILFE
jgi:glucosamine--fructose-6-phosphate aminotransferase (isomerizing)